MARKKVSRKVYGVIHHNHEVFLAGTTKDKKHLAKKFVENHDDKHSLAVFCCSSDNGFVSTNFLHRGENFEATSEHEKTIIGIFKSFLLGHKPSLEHLNIPQLIPVGDEVEVIS